MKKLLPKSPNKNTKIAIIFPAFNEELTVIDTIISFYNALPEANIWVINNNSTDNTEKLVREFFKSNNINGGLINEFQQGKGAALRRAFLEIDADIYVICDADLTYPAESIHDLIYPVINGQCDISIGDRLKGGFYAKTNKRNFHQFGNWLVTFLVNSLFHAKLSDVMSGYRVFNRRFIKHYPILVNGFEIETDMTLYALDNFFRIKEIPITYKNRPKGSFSKLNTFSDGIRVIKTILIILKHYKPMLFFGSLSLVFMLLGLFAGYPVIQDWIQFKYIYHVPLAILSTGLELISFILFTIAIILDSVAYVNKQNLSIKILSD
jgi:glycosyltransferase involved in cell wall biosynthesis